MKIVDDNKNSVFKHDRFLISFQNTWKNIRNRSCLNTEFSYIYIYIYIYIYTLYYTILYKIASFKIFSYMVLFQRGKWSILCTNIKKLPIWERLCKTSEISVRTENVFFYLTFTQTGLVFGFLIYLSVCLSVCLSLSFSFSLSKWS